MRGEMRRVVERRNKSRKENGKVQGGRRKEER